VSPEPDFSGFEDNNISVDGLCINFSKGISAFEIDSGIKEGDSRICLVEIGEEE
jgi:hypothetical protein